MENMQLTHLGTAAAEGWPAPFCHCKACARARARGGRDIRTRSQALIDDAILIDLPGDTIDHANRFGLDLGAVDHLLVTHSHLDHFSTFDLQLRVAPYAHTERPLAVYCNEAVRKAFVDSLEYYMAHYPKYIHFHVIHALDAFDIGEYHVEALKADHKPDEESLFYRVSRGEQAVLYAHDTGYFPEETWRALRGKHNGIVSLDCTYCLEPCDNQHMGLPEAARVRERMLDEGMADARTVFIINHFTHNCAGENGYAEIAAAATKRGFLTAYDGMVTTHP